MFSDIGEKIEAVLLNTLLFILLLAVFCVPFYLCVSVATARERAEQLEKARQDIIELQLKLMEAHNELDSAIHELAELKLATK